MTPHPPSRHLAITGWIIQRNPTYLISACLVALGARSYLADPADPAGDITLIVVTLIAVQFYEWSVGSILLLLHKARRSPEDLRSLLLVGTLFWTGPLATTLEMVVYRPDLGIIIAIGVSLIAIIEVITIDRLLKLNFGLALMLLSIGAIALLTVGAKLMTSAPAESGINELYLYALWWALAALILPSASALRRIDQPGFDESNYIPLTNVVIRRGFLAITIIALCVHLVGMNYAFFCHASEFYAAPVILAVAYVGISLIDRRGKEQRLALTILTGLPVIAILLATGTFRSEVPVELLPTVLQRPLGSILLPSVVLWFYGYWRHRWTPLLHLANGATAYSVVYLLGEELIGSFPLPISKFVIILYAIALYFACMAMIHRSRTEGTIALLVNMFATIIAVRDKTYYDDLTIFLTIGWTLFLGIHLAVPRPGLTARLFAVAMLLVLPWFGTATGEIRWVLAIYCHAVLAMLLVFGVLAPWTRYRAISLVIVAIEAIVFGGRLIAVSDNPTAAVFVIGGFGLLAGGTLVSWNKERLLDGITRKLESESPPSLDESAPT